MKNINKISTKLYISFTLSYLIWNGGWVFHVLFLLNNTANQNMYVAIGSIAIWLTTYAMALVTIYIRTRQLDKDLKRISSLPNPKLIKLSETALNLPIFTTVLFLIIYFIASPLQVYLYYYVSGSSYTMQSGIFMTLAGFVAVTPIPFFSSGYFLHKINAKISEKLAQKKIQSKPIVISFRFKTLFSFISAIVGMSLFILTFQYYYSTNKIIKNKLDNYQYYQENTIKYNNLKTLDRQELFNFVENIKYQEDVTVLIADKKANIIFKTNDINFWNELTTDRIKNSIKNGTADAFYENNLNNIISLVPINNEYTLFFISSAKDISAIFSDFKIWAAIMLFMTFYVIMTILYFYNNWTVASMNQLKKLLQILSTGDFTKVGGKSSSDEMGEMVDNYNLLLDKNSSLISQVNISSSQVGTASKQLSSIAQQISHKANEQAATTEEIASSMEQMLAMINSNTENAELTEKISSKSAKGMNQGNTIFLKTLQSVTEISEKITIISEIANKTDILSINASIEAASAGESGKGFSVIASEIRKLADKTKKASIDIENLSKIGKNYSQITSKLFEKLIPEIVKSADHVNDIVSSGKEQQSGVENINTSIQQLTEITNQNSASAEEMSASAEELSSQAGLLKELISGFTIENSQNEDIKPKEENIQVKKITDSKENGFNIILPNKEKIDDGFERF